MDETVTVGKEHFGDFQGVRIVIFSNKLKGADDGNPLLPKCTVSDHLIEQRSVFVKKPFAQNQMCGAINQIPIVDIPEVSQIEVHPKTFFGSFVKLGYKYQQGCQTNLVIGTFYELL